MNTFIYNTPTKVFLGPDTEKEVGKIIKEYGYKKVLLHYGGGSIKKTGLYDRVVKSLEEAGLDFVEMGGISPNPKVSLVRETVALCQKEKVDLILAVGGGSVIDSAKAVGVSAISNIDPWEFSMGRVKPTQTIPVGVILTISASGSEMSDSCVLTDEETMIKKGFNTDVIRPLFAIMNPMLTYSVSPYQTACGTTDIMMHTFERYFTHDQGFEITDNISLALLKTVYQAGKVVMKNPNDYNARANLMWASSLSHNGLTGVGRNYKMVVHALGHAVSGTYDFVHHAAGLSILFPAWAKLAYHSAVDKFAEVAYQVLEVDRSIAPKEAALLGIERLENYFKELGMPTRFSDLGIGTDQFELMANKYSNNGQNAITTIITVDKAKALEIFNLAK
jgi:alcohol dehydrogenase YqhD (iron-dependent ADH family)